MTSNRIRVVVAIAAHPDDVELGMGATLRLLHEMGVETYVIVLTRDRDEANAECRYEEAKQAAIHLGLTKPPLFASFIDGSLSCHAGSVSKVREIIATLPEPDLVFTHTSSDSHNDHRAANEITRAAFRQKCILCFAVPNSLELTGFNPELFVTVPDSIWETKLDAINSHKSQARLGRLMLEELQTYALRFSPTYSYVEPFELIEQFGNDPSIPRTLLAQFAAYRENSIYSRVIADG